MVPPNWDHPQVIRRNGQLGYQPMYDRSFEDAAREWKEEFAKWQAGERPSYYTLDEGDPVPEFWEWHGMPPEREYYQTWDDKDATWYQVWETVSEGTPVSPPFATNGELIEYLVANGDYWDQKRREEKRQGRPVGMNCDPWSRKAAEAFVNGPGWAPSAIMDSNGIRSGVEALADQAAD